MYLLKQLLFLWLRNFTFYYVLWGPKEETTPYTTDLAINLAQMPSPAHLYLLIFLQWFRPHVTKESIPQFLFGQISTLLSQLSPRRGRPVENWWNRTNYWSEGLLTLIAQRAWIFQKPLTETKSCLGDLLLGVALLRPNDFSLRLDVVKQPRQIRSGGICGTFKRRE